MKDVTSLQKGLLVHTVYFKSKFKLLNIYMYMYVHV